MDNSNDAKKGEEESATAVDTRSEFLPHLVATSGKYLKTSTNTSGTELTSDIPRKNIA